MTAAAGPARCLFFRPSHTFRVQNARILTGNHLNCQNVYRKSLDGRSLPVRARGGDRNGGGVGSRGRLRPPLLPRTDLIFPAIQFETPGFVPETISTARICTGNR